MQPEWEDDEALQEDLELYVQVNLRQYEILDLVKINIPMYAWSLRSLSRRHCHIGISITTTS